jgi:thioredoxin 1
MANTNMVQLTDQNFKEEVLNSKIPVLVDFFAPWCGPCNMMEPILDELVLEFEGRIKFGRLNVDDNQKTSQEYEILSIPTIILFEQGVAQKTIIGALSKKKLQEKLEDFLK